MEEKGRELHGENKWKFGRQYIVATLKVRCMYSILQLQ